ncbi:MAG: hypothetical protein AAFR81_19835 [Chloroflexota bacterium]
MLEIVGFLAVTIIILLLAMYGAWRFFLSGDIRTAITQLLMVLTGRDNEVDPEKPLPPTDRVKSSEVVELRGEQAKQTMSIQRGNAMATPANRPATATPQPPQAVHAPHTPTPSANPQPHNPAVKAVVDNRVPPTQNPASTNLPTSPPVVPVNTQAMNAQAVPPTPPQAIPPQNANVQPTNARPHPGHALPPLVESHSFGVKDPIIDDVYIEEGTPSADKLNAHPPERDTSRFAVRSSSISPGRRIRDGRSSRNSS